MYIGNATLLGQVIMDFIEHFQEKQGYDTVSTCKIDLPFPVKHDFNEDIVSFANNTTSLYLLRFCAPDRNFMPRGTRLRVHTIGEEQSTFTKLISAMTRLD